MSDFSKSPKVSNKLNQNQKIQPHSIINQKIYTINIALKYACLKIKIHINCRKCNLG